MKGNMNKITVIANEMMAEVFGSEPYRDALSLVMVEIARVEPKRFYRVRELAEENPTYAKWTGADWEAYALQVEELAENAATVLQMGMIAYLKGEHRA